jgi:hypothetical protein
MLEQIAYKIPRNSEQKQVVYQVGDLEKLSASALYYGNGNGLGSFGIVSTPLMKKNKGEITIQPITAGMTLPGNLIIKDFSKNTVTLQQDFGGVGNIYTAHPDGGGATRFYGTGKGKARETKNVWNK